MIPMHVMSALHAALASHYEGAKFVTVMPLGEEAWKEEGLLERGAFLRPDTLNDTNHLQIFVYCNDDKRTCVVAARLDNLGKGASGAAVQNLNIAMGLEEGTGLIGDVLHRVGELLEECGDASRVEGVA